MGREAKIEAQLADKSGACTVLLEAHELILRGAIKAKLLLRELSDVYVQANGLHASTARGALWLGLSEAVARSWLKKMQEPPPTMASKLGIRAGVRVAFLQPDEEIAALVLAHSAEITPLADAQLWFTALNSSADLSDLLAQLAHTPLAKSQALWVLRHKGASAELKESTVMRELRALALVPTKTASVAQPAPDMHSEAPVEKPKPARTADRYVRAQ
jgi:hypothetical protein